MMRIKINLILYGLFLICFSIYSYALVDLNFTLINSTFWENFRNWIIQLGYFNRELSSYIYVFFIIGLFYFHYYFIKQSKAVSAFRLSIVIALTLFFSYNFLSHDFFNYLFDAKILTYYHQNPYTTKALDFPNDPWLRFMHWTHRTYPYGPIFLVLTSITSFISFGKFIISYFATKSMFYLAYLLSVFLLKKTDNRSAVFFATNPLVIVEGLINLHNDLIALAFSFIGVFYLIKNKQVVKTYTAYLLSVLIKYLNFPILFLYKNSKTLSYITLGLFHLLMLYIAIYKEIQPWYFLNYFTLLPFIYQSILSLNILNFSLLLSYYPYIRYSQWSDPENIAIKHSIILFGTAIYLIYAIKVCWQKRTYLKSKL